MYERGEKQKRERERKKEGKKEERRTGAILAGKCTDLSGYNRNVEILIFSSA